MVRIFMDQTLIGVKIALKNFFSSFSYGAVVFLVPTGSDMKCVLKSQMIRLLAYALPFIRDDDIIVTADVDAFVMTKDIYKPLLLPGRQIWIYRYAFTMGTGATFMMPFIGIKVRDRPYITSAKFCSFLTHPPTRSTFYT